MPGWFGTRKGGRLKGWRRVVARKRGSVIVPLLPFPLPLTPTSIHAHTDTRTRGQESHPRVHQAGTNLCTHATPRIHDRTREDRRMHVLSDAVTRTRNMHTRCSSVVFDLTVRNMGMEYLVKGLLDYAPPPPIV